MALISGYADFSIGFGLKDGRKSCLLWIIPTRGEHRVNFDNLTLHSYAYHATTRRHIHASYRPERNVRCPLCQNPFPRPR
jgi:hypothetical protein